MAKNAQVTTGADPYHHTYPEGAHTLKSALSQEGAGAKIKALLSWYKDSRLGRFLARYGVQRGALLAGGISYTALFSLFAALAIGITVFMALLGSNEQLRESVFKAINSAMPGLITVGGKEGLVDPESLVLSSPFTLAGLIALISLLLSATRVMQALKVSIRDMFGITVMPVSALSDKLRDAEGFVVIALSVLATAAVGVVASTAGGTIFAAIGLPGGIGSFLIRVLVLAGAALIDAGVFWMLVRFIAAVKVPKADLLKGLVVFALGAGILRWAGTSLVASVSDNPLLASAAALVTLLLWVNLLARVTLMVCAFMANPPRPAIPANREHIHADETPNYISVTYPHTLAWPHQSLTGAIEPDPKHDPLTIETAPRTPKWGGLVGRYKTWRLQHLRRRLQKAEADYYL